VPVGEVHPEVSTHGSLSVSLTPAGLGRRFLADEAVDGIVHRGYLVHARARDEDQRQRAGVMAEVRDRRELLERWGSLTVVDLGSDLTTTLSVPGTR